MKNKVFLGYSIHDGGKKKPKKTDPILNAFSKRYTQTICDKQSEADKLRGAWLTTADKPKLEAQIQVSSRLWHVPGSAEHYCFGFGYQ